jgi:Ca2+-binding RTX toxin-like protein
MDQIFQQPITRVNNTLNGGAGNDTVDYSATNLAGLAGQATAGIVANLATGIVTKSFAAGTSIDLGGVVGRYIRIYRRADAGSAVGLTGLKVFAGGIDVAAGKASVAGADANLGGGVFNNKYALTDAAMGERWNGQSSPDGLLSNVAYATGLKPYIELDLGQSYLIDSMALWGDANAFQNSRDLRVYVSATPFVSSATAYADLAVNPVVARVDVATVDTAITTFTDTLSGIENLVGTALADSLNGDGNRNRLWGGAGNDLIHAGDGEDYVYGEAGDDVLYGDNGLDYIFGAQGNDSLLGGDGNDTLAGGTGSDNYNFRAGDGADVVRENDATAGNNDTLRFLDARHDQLWLRRLSNNLEVSRIDTGDKVTMIDWYLGNQFHVEQIQAFGDGKTLLDTNVDLLVQAMASFAPPAVGQTELPANYYRYALAPVLAASRQ